LIFHAKNDSFRASGSGKITWGKAHAAIHDFVSNHPVQARHSVSLIIRSGPNSTSGHLVYFQVSQSSGVALSLLRFAQR
jgi:hypothetical protein